MIPTIHAQHDNSPTYLSLPNFSCHFPLTAAAGAVLRSSAISSMVSCKVAMAPSPGSGIGASGDAVVMGKRRMSALDVFFCRKEYVFPGVFRTAERSEDERVRLGARGGSQWRRRGQEEGSQGGRRMRRPRRTPPNRLPPAATPAPAEARAVGNRGRQGRGRAGCRCPLGSPYWLKWDTARRIRVTRL